MKKAWLVLLLPACVLVGCGGGKLVTARGTVTLNGGALADPTMMFYPVGHQAMPGFAAADGAGRFSVSTGNEKGIAPGQYKVTVVKTQRVAPSPTNVPKGVNLQKLEGGDNAERRDFNTRKRNKLSTVQNVLPEKYADPKTTPIQITVRPGGEPDLVIALIDEP
jgi:hypothetical protein